MPFGDALLWGKTGCLCRRYTICVCVCVWYLQNSIKQMWVTKLDG